jgi:hypothetical protein
MKMGHFQGKAPALFHADVKNFLDCAFAQRWIGRRGNAMELLP